MADDLRGIGAPGHRLTETVGGPGERAEAIRHTRDLLLRRMLEAAFVAVWVPLIAGPWALCYYIPVAFRYAVDVAGTWLGIVPDWLRSQEYLYRGSLVCFGLAVALGLLVLDDWALFWWPWRWQIPASTGRGLLWPGWWRAAIPSAVLIRAILVIGPWRAWRIEETHLTNRQRTEIEASGAAYALTELHDVDIPGVRNPHRDPNAPALPAPKQNMARAMIWLPEGAPTTRARIIECPPEIANGMQLEELAHMVLVAGVSPTRSQVTKRGIFTDPGWRAFVEWALAEGLVWKTGKATNATYALTDDGRAWLNTVAGGVPV